VVESRARSRLRGRGGRRGRPRPGDDGFTIIESALALGLIFTICLALLSSLATGVRGVVTGRQRSGATQLANQVLETAKARSYERVGHSLSDTSLAADAAITGTSPSFYFAGQPLAIATDVASPFIPHRDSSSALLVDGVQYTRSVYVTLATPASGDPYKRVTVTVSWAASQYGTSAIPNKVSLTSYVYNSAPPPDPLLQGIVDTNAGKLTVTGTLSGLDLSNLQQWFPYAHGEIDSSFIKQSKGFAWTGRSQINLNSGSPSGCTTSGSAANCAGTKAETVADNDGGTAPPENDSQGPFTDFGGTVNGGSGALPLQSTFGSGTAQSTSTSRSCFSCFGPDIGDDDLYPYHASSASGPSSGSVTFGAGPVSGSLLEYGGAACASNCAMNTVDVDRVSTDPRITSTASTSAPALDVLALNGAPVGFDGMVRVSANSVTATAAAGPGAPAPTVSGGSFNVQMYDTGGLPGYVTVPVTPGVAASQSTSASFNIGLASLTLDATVISRAGSTASTSAGSVRSHGEASLTNWLTVTVRLQITLLGTPLADLTVELDYGVVSAHADYAPAP
jgi:type II secretory pathway pseudopilin PulG